ncbi:hypothetical protein AALO_G00011100 [Alosa alosa]|uniref:Uncharacterized protein n=1 Tax=Alosa alosa TaxID=278164 RepID=A0AAV6HJ63_9TELE|nr:hypothetical protein AALO_G00011100 [Alosa alosa]
MATIKPLMEIEDLSRSRFGQPSPPRHGLQLLFWFAREYITFDNNNQIVMIYNPREGRFGFHRFQNRIDNYQDGRLLPSQSSPYYEVGNLHSLGANDLPLYVRKNFTHHIDGSNSDRLIIGLDSNGKIYKVYVTQHEDLRNFSHDRTYRLSESLLYEIHNIASCETFLEEVIKGKSKAKTRQRPDVHIDMDSNIRSTTRKKERCCTIL